MKNTIKDILLSILFYCTSFFITFATNYFIARKIGPSLYGDVIIAQNIVLYFSLLIAFGFDITSSREISQAMGDHKKIEEIFNKTIISRFLLLIISGFIFMSLIWINGASYSEKILLISTFSITIGFVAFPMWYFQGIQRNYIISICVLIPKVLSFFCILLFVKEKDDYVYINFINGAFFSIVGVVTLLLVIRKNNFKIYIINLKIIGETLKSSFSLCLSNLIDNLYFTLCLLLIQILVYRDLGYFSAVHKLIEISKGIILIPIGQVFFPLVSIAALQSKVVLTQLLSKLLLIMTFVGIVGSIALFLLSEVIINLAYGYNFSPSIHFLQMISPIILLLCINNIISRQGLLGINQDKQRLVIVFFSGFFAYLLLMFFSISTEKIIYALLLTEFFSIILSLFFLRKRGINLLNIGNYTAILSTFVRHYVKANRFLK